MKVNRRHKTMFILFYDKIIRKRKANHLKHIFELHHLISIWE